MITVQGLTDALADGMYPSQLIHGSALQVEDLDVTLSCTIFLTAEGRVRRKWKGRVSKRRLNNMVKMARKRDWAQIKRTIDHIRSKE